MLTVSVGFGIKYRGVCHHYHHVQGEYKWVSNTRFTHAPVCSLCEMNHLTNRRHSDGTPLDGRHGISGVCDGISWRCITKCDTLSWLDHTRFRTTVRVSKQEQVMFESSSKIRKSWNGWQLIWQWVPDIWSNRWKWFGGCNGGFTWGKTDSIVAVSLKTPHPRGRVGGISKGMWPNEYCLPEGTLLQYSSG